MRRWGSLALTVGGPTALAFALLDLGVAAFAGDAGSPVPLWLAGWIGAALGVGAALGWRGIEAIGGPPLLRAATAAALGWVGAAVAALQPTYVRGALDDGPGAGLEGVVVFLQGLPSPAVAVSAGLLLGCSVATAVALHTRATRPGGLVGQCVRAALVTVAVPVVPLLSWTGLGLNAAGWQSSILVALIFAANSVLFGAPLAALLVVTNALAKVELVAVAGVDPPEE